MLIDLQIHSTYSDGYLTPTELAGTLHKKGIKVAALTDHNTVGGLDLFRKACKKYKIKPISGIELYVTYKRKRMNMLWYNFDEVNQKLHKILKNSHVRRKTSVRKILERLIRRGMKIDIDKLFDKYTRYTPVNHIIDDIWSTPANRKVIKERLELKNPREEDIIREFFRNPDIGMLRETYIGLERILKIKKEVGGQLVLNHPAKHRYIKVENIEELRKLDIDGIEVLSPHHSVGAVMYIQQLAREFNFIETGGSDFHKFEGYNYPIQSSWDYFTIDSKLLRNVDRIIG